MKKKREEKAACVAEPRKAQQEERLARPGKGKVQERKRRVRRAEGSEAACPEKGNAQQKEWKRSL